MNYPTLNQVNAMTLIEYNTKLSRRAQLKARLDNYDYLGRSDHRTKDASEFKELTKQLNAEHTTARIKSETK